MAKKRRKQNKRAQEGERQKQNVVQPKVPPRREPAVFQDGSVRRERPWSGWIGAAYLTAAIALTAVALGFMLPTVQSFTTLDSPVLRQTRPIVLVGMDVSALRAEFHMQPQQEDDFPDGLKMVMSERSELAEATDKPPDESHPTTFVVAFPPEIVEDTDRALATVALDNSCDYESHVGDKSDLPEPARAMADGYRVFRYTETCKGRPALYLDLMGIAPQVYEHGQFDAALRLPPVAYFDHESKVNTEGASTAGQLGEGSCDKTTVLLDTYELKATEWLGADTANIIIPTYRTAAIYWGGTDERPVGWLAQERRPYSRISAPCMSQGVGIDLLRSNGSESKTANQVYAGVFFGAATGLLIPGVESGAAWMRRRLSKARP